MDKLDKIAEIKSTMCITELVNHLGMVVNGSGFAHSIYKKEETPSMKIYFDDNRFWCFAMSKGGDVINLYEDYYNIDTGTAINELAGLCGIENSEVNNSHERVDPVKSFAEEMGELNNKREQLFFCLSEYEIDVYQEMRYKNEYANENEAHEFCLREVQRLRLHNNRLVFKEFYNYTKDHYCQEALDYLIKVRKLPIETLNKFKVCTINNYFQINNHMKKVFKDPEILKSTGLFSAKGNLAFPKHRIVIPYIHSGNIVYLRGRYFDQENNTTPVRDEKYGMANKYMGLRNDKLNLNRTKRFFNYDIIRTLFKGERLFLVEGEFDAMALDSMGYHAIAIPGAGNMPDVNYFIPLLEFQIILCMDSDEAGNGLRERLLKIFSDFKKKVSIKKLPTKDINDFLAS